MDGGYCQSKYVFNSVDNRVLPNHRIRPKILLGAPSAYVAAIYSGELEKMGYDVQVCDNCNEVASIYQRALQNGPHNGANPFFAVVLDEDMPGVIQIMGKILSFNNNQKFILAMRDVPLFPAEHKCIKIIVKPFPVRLLSEMLDSLYESVLF